MERIITAIPPTKASVFDRKRVAAYARVSCEKDSMLHSLSAQISYYSGYIQRRPDWEYVGVFADEAVTGTKGSRPEFQRMLAECRAGKIDLIITKSISRFARNTLLLLNVVRELKDRNIDVYFEEQNIHSMSGDGELMLTILASYAQEESRSVSENCKWRVRNGFKKGVPGNYTMLGYRQINGTLEIVPEEAAIVRRIFTEYLEGKGRNAIMRGLIADGVPTRLCREWNESRIYTILRNEKYHGRLVLQKTFYPDHLTKKKYKNIGQLPRYIIEHAHEAIIDKETFDRAQEEMARRAARVKASPWPRELYPFTGLMTCMHCGKRYFRKIARAGTKYAAPVWICSTFDTKGRVSCPSKQIPEDVLTAVACEVIGQTQLETGTFRQQIKAVLVHDGNRLVFEFFDDRAIEKVWQDKSRKWSAEAKERARQQQLARTIKKKEVSQ